MHDLEYAARIEAVKQRAHGRWSEILAGAGVDERILKHRNGPCPLCGALILLRKLPSLLIGSLRR